MIDKDGKTIPQNGQATDSVPIWDLEVYTGELDNNALFFVSRPLQKSVYRSYNLGYSAISVDNYHAISAFPNTKVTGDWKFSEENGGGISANYKITDAEEDNSLVLNIDYLSSRFLRKLSELSTEIYDANHMPSFVGQVIYSTTLRTEERVRRYYGDYTRWEPIEGRFIMASAQDGNIGKMTGDFETQLTINDTPTHSHMVTAIDNPKTTRLNWTISPTSTTVAKMGADSNGPDTAGDGTMYLVYINGEMREGYTIEWTGKCERDEWRDERVAVIYGRNADHGKGTANVTANKGENQPHNNIPPFVTVFAWKRTK